MPGEELLRTDGGATELPPLTVWLGPPDPPGAPVTVVLPVCGASVVADADAGAVVVAGTDDSEEETGAALVGGVVLVVPPPPLLPQPDTRPTVAAAAHSPTVHRRRSLMAVRYPAAACANADRGRVTSP